MAALLPKKGPVFLAIEVKPTGAATLDDFVTSIAVSPDGSKLAACAASGQVVIFGLPDLASTVAASGHALDATRVAWSPSGGAVASAGHDGAVRVWSAETGAEVVNLPLKGWVEHLAWDRRTNLIAAAANKGVQVWDGSTYATVATYPDHRSAVSSLEWLPQPTGSHLLVAAYGGVMRYDVTQPEPAHAYEYQGAPMALAVPPNGSWLIVGNLDQSIHLWPLTGPNVDKEGSDLHMWGFTAKVNHLAFDWQNRYFYNADGNTIVVWKMPKLDGAKGKPLEAHEQWVSALAPQPRGDLVASGDEAGVVCIWRADKSKPSFAEQLAPGGVTALAWTPDGKHLAVGAHDGQIGVYRVSGRG